MFPNEMAAINPAELVAAFLTAYYQRFDQDVETRTTLYQLYDETALLKYEGQDITTRQGIADKYKSLPFQSCQHKITSYDHFLLGDTVLICVFGQLLADQDAPFSFAETFITKFSPENSSLMIFLHNFRLILHSA
ncbi:nuclear transport factor 2-like [Oopsacas minuta]|uniref:NTF2-related export protein n=1 Tax=Oopsacas minuta TaxID=111878 RepID=A0AAV7K8V2_9METZ|nr:nuclear transport factor 2-like [Oopsacas minuta]